MNVEKCKQHLMEVTKKLDPVLNPLGYVFEISTIGRSSPGPYAAGSYRNGDKKIGLVYRSISGFGAVTYEYHHLGVTHSHLMGYLGKREVSRLKYNSSNFWSYGKGGGNVIDALVYDIQNFGVEFLTSSEDQFDSTLKEIVRAPEPQDTSELTLWIWAGLVLLVFILCAVILYFQL